MKNIVSGFNSKLFYRVISYKTKTIFECIQPKPYTTILYLNKKIERRFQAKMEARMEARMCPHEVLRFC